MLKLSGEALMGNQDFGIDLNTINAITDQIIYVFKKGIKVSIVVGGGIRTPEDAKNLVDSGASVIVTGGAIEQDREKMRKFSDAIHVKF